MAESVTEIIVDDFQALGSLTGIICVIRQIGKDHVTAGTIQDSFQIVALGAISTQQAMVAEHPQVARFANRLSVQRGRVIGIGQRLLGIHGIVASHDEHQGSRSPRPIDRGHQRRGQGGEDRFFRNRGKLIFP